MASLEDFNSIENLLMHMAWLQLSIEFQFIYSIDNCSQAICMSRFSILLKSSRQATPVTFSFSPIEGRTACRRPGLVKILVVDRFF